MFGKNAVTKMMPADAPLNVHSIFYTIQGEGPWAGLPTIFVRFAGCNLRCFWCDTDFEKGTLFTAEGLVDELLSWSEKYNCIRFVLTGGEPLIQPLPAFFSMVTSVRADKRTRKAWGWEFQAETAGTVWPAGLETAVGYDERLMLVCSPKTAKVHPQIEKYCRDWKYIVESSGQSSEDGLPIRSTQSPGVGLKLYRPPGGPREWEGDRDDRKNYDRDDVIWVQPMDEQDSSANERNLQAAAQIAMKHNYRLSVQVHKLVGLP